MQIIRSLTEVGQGSPTKEVHSTSCKMEHAQVKHHGTPVLAARHWIVLCCLMHVAPISLATFCTTCDQMEGHGTAATCLPNRGVSGSILMALGVCIGQVDPYTLPPSSSAQTQSRMSCQPCNHQLLHVQVLFGCKAGRTSKPEHTTFAVTAFVSQWQSLCACSSFLMCSCWQSGTWQLGKGESSGC